MTNKILNLIDKMIEKTPSKRVTIGKIVKETGLAKDSDDFEDTVEMFKDCGFSVVDDYYDDVEECESNEFDECIDELKTIINEEEEFEEQLTNNDILKFEEDILKDVNNLCLAKKRRITDAHSGILESLRDYELLSRDEEKEEAFIYQEGLNTKILLEKISMNNGEISPTLSEKYKQIIERGEEARDILYNHNQRLVYSIAKRFVNRGLDIDDLFQVGGMGLLKAIEKYDPNKDNRLSTYATYWIRQAIQRHIGECGYMIKPSTHLFEDKLKVVKVINELTIKLGRPPLPEDVSKILGMSLKRVNRIFNNDYLCSSLNDICCDDDTEKLDFIMDQDTDNPYDYSCKFEENERLNQAFSLLSERDLSILKMRFGLDGMKEMTLCEIAKIYDMSDEGIRQNIKRSCKKIKDYIEYNTTECNL
ncbi:MAG: sigma-70 family RNA polymerase sigma factor [Bacilli bacterium]|nr:sigma-70 family RNA polymerase sigma factor [Bacilli bacterium]